MTAWPLTARGSGLLVAAVGCWLLGRLFGVRELAIAAVATAALLGLALLVIRVLSTRLRVDRRVSPTHLQMGQQGHVDVSLTNAGRLPTASLRVDDAPPRQLAAAARFVTRPLEAAESVRLRYVVSARRRGVHTVGPTVVEVRDPFGVARRSIELGAADEVVVYPRILALEGGPPLAGHLSTGSDGHPRPGASGEDLDTVREYVQGDDLRRVHWRSTAHRGRLMVRQEENRQRPDAVVLVDPGPERHVVTAAASSFEVMVTAAASVLWMLRERQFRTRLVDGPLSGSPPARSWEQTMGLLSAADPAPVDLMTLWRQLERGAAGEGSLVAIVPTPDPALLRQMVRAGRTFGARVAVLVDPPPAPRRRDHERHDAEEATAALRSAGWYATLVADEDALPDAWQRLAVHRTGVAP